jgi:hypothetical protein
LALSDLNWARSLSIRQAIAQCADRHVVLRQLDNLQRLEIEYSKGFHSTAMLVACWMAAQLRWTVVARKIEPHRPLIFRSPSGSEIACTLQESPQSEAQSPAVLKVELHSADTSLTLQHQPGAAPIASHLSSPEGVWDSRFYAGSESLGNLISAEMNPGIHHRVYLKALSVWQALF